MADSPNSYVINVDIYDNEYSEINNLIKNVFKIHTSNNWFTSIRLVELLKEKSLTFFCFYL